MCGSGTGAWARMGHCILCQTFTLQLIWEFNWEFKYFDIVSVPVLVPVPHKFCLIRTIRLMKEKCRCWLILITFTLCIIIGIVLNFEVYANYESTFMVDSQLG